jgi:ribosomal protein L14E/L6E/L27E
MLANNLQLGQAVRSVAGRDAGKIFLLVGVVDDKNVLVVDGNLRKIESPKKKNIKHLQPHNYIDKVIQSKLLGNEKITNLEISSALTALVLQDEKDKDELIKEVEPT